MTRGRVPRPVRASCAPGTLAGASGARARSTTSTPDQVAAAAGLVRSGKTVTLSLPLSTHARPDSPQPAEYRMTMMPDEDIGLGSVRFAKDYIGADYHNEGHTHIDAFSHVSYDGSLLRRRAPTAR